MDKPGPICRRPVLVEDRSLAALSPILRRVYGARGVRGPQDLDYRTKRLLPPDFLGIGRASQLLADAIQRSEPILIAGDFDADGATGCALAVRALGGLGARVDYAVPDRFRFGYGLTPEFVSAALERDPKLIVTVDNGISSLDGVRLAQDAGVRVLVTDHHLPGKHLPAADAIVNPNQPGCPFASKHLAGVGVIFYVLAALRARLRDDGWFSRNSVAQLALADHLDLVALGTIADVVPLDRNNRILVEQGLRRIRAGRGRPGIRHLARLGGRAPEHLVSSDIAFAVAPRLNAAGRLEDMCIGIECLLADEEAHASRLAQRLDSLNSERRSVENAMREAALAAVADLQLDSAELPHGLCLYEPDWHPGIVGIVAARIRETVHRPVVAFAKERLGVIKGSGRSVPEANLRDILAAIAIAHPGMIERFGGHAMAAGLSLREECLDGFRKAFAREVGCRLGSQPTEQIIWSDGSVNVGDITLESAEQLRRSGPWGCGFPEPLFDHEFQVLEARVVGERHLKLLLRHPDGGRPVSAIRFGWDRSALIEPGEWVHLAFTLQVNEYRGVRAPQMVVAWMGSL